MNDRKKKEHTHEATYTKYGRYETTDVYVCSRKKKRKKGFKRAIDDSEGATRREENEKSSQRQHRGQCEDASSERRRKSGGGKKKKYEKKKNTRRAKENLTTLVSRRGAIESKGRKGVGWLFFPLSGCKSGTARRITFQHIQKGLAKIKGTKAQGGRSMG